MVAISLFMQRRHRLRRHRSYIQFTGIHSTHTGVGIDHIARKIRRFDPAQEIVCRVGELICPRKALHSGEREELTLKDRTEEVLTLHTDGHRQARCLRIPALGLRVIDIANRPGLAFQQAFPLKRPNEATQLSIFELRQILKVAT